MLTVDQYVAWALTTLVSAFLGSYLAGYLKKKGENLATHEDINKLVAQVTAVTEATKKIEAEISTGVWDKQKRWDMKREVLFQAAKSLAEIEAALQDFSFLMKQDRANQEAWKTQPPAEGQEFAWVKAKGEAVERWRSAVTEFQESMSFVTVVCSRETAITFFELSALINTVAVQVVDDPDSYDKSRSEVFKEILSTQMAIRKELEVDA